jgi:hypothetical protein
MRLRFFFTQTDQDEPRWDAIDRHWVTRMKEQLLASGTPRHALTEDPDEADVILFWEPHQDSQMLWAPRLRTHPLVQRYPDKAFTVWLDDAPLGFLPRLYTSLPERLYDATRHRTWIYWRPQNPFVHSVERHVATRPSLASFQGAYTHYVRQWLFDLAPRFAREDIIIRESPNHRSPSDPNLAGDQRRYVELILDAKFSLCPRGNGTGTFRLQESMSLGRTPVIISDEWVPIEGPDWNQCAVFIAEEQLEHLPTVLRRYEDRWEEMGRNARAAWEHWFRPEDYALHALDRITDIYTHRRHDEHTHFTRWDELIAPERRLRGRD